MKNVEFTLLFKICYDAFFDLPSMSLMSFLLCDAFRARNKSFTRWNVCKCMNMNNEREKMLMQIWARNYEKVKCENKQCLTKSRNFIVV